MKRNIPCINNDSHRDTEILEQIKENDVKALVSVQHLFKLSPEVLQAVNYCSYNLHNARLPNYKGYNCTSHAILNGDRKYYSTLHRMTDEVDAGPLIKELSTPITENDTAESLYAKSQELSFELFKFIITQLSDGKKIETVPYNSNSKGKWYSKHDINKFRCINNLHDFQEVDRKSRAFYFQNHEPSYFLLGDKRFYVSPHISKE